MAFDYYSLENGESPLFDHSLDGSYLFGKTLDIKESRVVKMINEFRTANEAISEMIDRSFLRDDLKELYKELFTDKKQRLNIEWKQQ